MAAIIVRLKPGETTDQLVRRFQRAVKEFTETIKKPRVFVSKTELRLLAAKEKIRKIKKLERDFERG